MPGFDSRAGSKNVYSRAPAPPGPYGVAGAGKLKACPTCYQTRQALALTIGWPGLQENAFWNSGMFSSVPMTR